jgi:hypothetical protein
MVGIKVKHVETGEIKEIARYCSNGTVWFTDGIKGDIHHARDPKQQRNKKWRYINGDIPPLYPIY